MDAMRTINRSADAEQIHRQALRERDVCEHRRGEPMLENEADGFYCNCVGMFVHRAMLDEMKPFIDFLVRLRTYRLVPGLTADASEVEAMIDTTRTRWLAVYEELCPSCDSGTTPASARPSQK
jgi:hypothetical protein